MSDKQARIKELETQIKSNRALYYSNPEKTRISDVSFDLLEDELRKLDPTNEVLSEVGAAPSGNWPKRSHEIHMGSLKKTRDGVRGIPEWMASLEEKVRNL